jgi:adenylate kinase family enzyme
MRAVIAIILTGAPGAGKSTVAAALASDASPLAVSRLEDLMNLAEYTNVHPLKAKPA